jgi:3-methylcrotonyl-CoA carboxylase alpha subunit
MAEPIVTRVARGMYRVEIDGRSEIVYVAGPADDRGAFWNGQIFWSGVRADTTTPAGRRAQAEQSLMAPMPATVVKVHVQPGSLVKNGDTLVVLEAMKMELVIRAPADGRVTAVHCQERQLVQPNHQLVDLDITADVT